MENKGILYALGAYIAWGLLPVYWKALETVPAIQILGHRIVWSFVIIGMIILARREWRKFRYILAYRNKLLYGSLGAGLLGVNWLVYIWAVNSDHIVEASLGYFINPLVSVLLGVIFFKEKLRPAQWLVVGLAALGVLYLTFHYGTPPWISLVLALTFGFYGLLKKKSSLEALHGLGLEMAFLVLPALGYLLFVQYQGNGSFVQDGAVTTVLLIVTGVVTAMPILLFGFAARSIPLSLVGLLQYIAPTMQFLLGVLVYSEPFTQERLIGFSIIWMALLIYWLEGLNFHRRTTSSDAIA
jgi:chloramphenicol-sensitive protein RarD